MAYPDWLLKYIEVANMSYDTIRSLAWTSVRWCISTLSALFQGFMDLFDLDAFMASMSFVDTSNGIVSKIIPSLFALCLMFGGFLLIINNQRAKKELFSGVVVSILLLIMTPYTISTMEKITDLVTDGMVSIFASEEAGQNAAAGIYSPEDSDGTDFLDLLVQSNTVDILASRQNGKISFLSSDPDVIDINERVGGYFGHADLFSTDGSGKPLKSDNWIFPEMTNEGLYRYQINFVQMILISGILLISVILAGVRAAATIYEIVFNQIIAPIVFATDLMQTGRAKAFMQRIIATYVSLMIILFSLLMYVKLTSWVCVYVKNWWAVFFLLVGFTMAMFNGPDSVVKLIGIDVGTRSGAAPFVSTAAVVSQAISITSMAAARAGGGSGGTSQTTASSASTGGTRSAPESSLAKDGSTPSTSPKDTAQQTNTHSESRQSQSNTTHSSTPSAAPSDRAPSPSGSVTPSESRAAASSAAASAASQAVAETSVSPSSFADSGNAHPPQTQDAPQPHAPNTNSTPSYMPPPSLDFMPPSMTPSRAPTPGSSYSSPPSSTPTHAPSPTPPPIPPPSSPLGGNHR